MRTKLNTHGYVGVIGPDTNPNYFTGVGYSTHLNEAKTFRTAGGCRSAIGIFQTADYNPRPLGESFWSTRRVLPVVLQIAE